MPSKKTLLLLILIIAGITFLTFLYSNTVSKSSSAIKSSGATERVVVDKAFELEAYVGNTNEKAPVTAHLKNVQKTNSITISGKKNTLKSGSTFVLLTFVIENNTSERLVFPTRDIVRYIDPNDKKFAPSISEKAIVLEPQATKIDTIGFVEPANIKTMKFSIGELEKTKETIEINFAN
jgi:hypothetical protein